LFRKCRRPNAQGWCEALSKVRKSAGWEGEVWSHLAAVVGQALSKVFGQVHENVRIIGKDSLFPQELADQPRSAEVEGVLPDLVFGIRPLHPPSLP
jgi:hypothetical protein